jgi:hypothetical protein
MSHYLRLTINDISVERLTFFTLFDLGSVKNVLVVGLTDELIIISVFLFKVAGN